MKFWEKVFLATLCLFLIAFNTGIFLVVNKTYKDGINSEIQKAFDIHHFISEYLIESILNQANITNNTADNEKILKTKLLAKSQYYKHKNIYLELLLDNKTIYSNTKNVYGNRDELILNNSSSVNSIIRNISGTKYIFVAGKVNILNKYYTLVSITNLTSFIKNHNKLNSYLLRISIVISIILSTFLYFILRKLSKPIQLLTNSTQKITRGYYDERIRINGNDELSLLGKNFNVMADSIQTNIQKMKESVNQKQQFIDNFAHELRTPLTSIYGYAEYIQKLIS